MLRGAEKGALDRGDDAAELPVSGRPRQASSGRRWTIEPVSRGVAGKPVASASGTSRSLHRATAPAQAGARLNPCSLVQDGGINRAHSEDYCVLEVTGETEQRRAGRGFLEDISISTNPDISISTPRVFIFLPLLPPTAYTSLAFPPLRFRRRAACGGARGPLQSRIGRARFHSLLPVKARRKRAFHPCRVAPTRRASRPTVRPTPGHERGGRR